MKKIIYISIILLLANSSHSQTKLTYEQVSNPDNRIRTNDLTEYVSKNGEVFKVGETLTIGNPSGDLDTYNFIDNYDAFGTSYKVTLQNKGFDSEIIKFRTSGNKRRGYEIIAISKTETGTSRYYTQLERAIESGEVETSVLTREQAIKKLKEQKDLLDLGLISEKEYNSIKEKLTPLILEN